MVWPGCFWECILIRKWQVATQLRGVLEMALFSLLPYFVRGPSVQNLSLKWRIHRLRPRFMVSFKQQFCIFSWLRIKMIFWIDNTYLPMFIMTCLFPIKMHFITIFKYFVQIIWYWVLFETKLKSGIYLYSFYSPLVLRMYHCRHKILLETLPPKGPDVIHGRPLIWNS